MRMDRRAGLLSGGKLTLRQLWASADLISSYGASPTSLTKFSMTLVGGTATPVWVVCFTGNGIDFSKIKNNVITSLKTARLSDTYPPVYTAKASGANTVLTMSGSSYGVVFLAFRFPGLTEDVVDLCFSSMYLEMLAGRNASSSGPVRIEASLVTEDNMYMQLHAGASSANFSLSQGSDELLLGTSDIIYWYHYVASTINQYRLSVNGTSEREARVAGFCRLSDTA